MPHDNHSRCFHSTILNGDGDTDRIELSLPTSCDVIIEKSYRGLENSAYEEAGEFYLMLYRFNRLENCRLANRDFSPIEYDFCSVLLLMGLFDTYFVLLSTANNDVYGH